MCAQVITEGTMRKLILILLTISLTTVTGYTKVDLWKNTHGDELAYDGVFYSYRSANALHAFKVWTPPQEGPIRGLLLFGNPGGGYGGDTRDKTTQQDLLHFATRKGIAVAGVNGFSGRRTYDELGQYILRGLQSMGEYGKHPELATIPFLVSGGSNAGSFSYSMMCLAPERTIAITPNVGGYFSLNAPKAAADVPVWIHIGTIDSLSSSGVENTEQLFEINAADRPLFWAWDAEIKGHENGGADHVDIPYWDEIIDLRLPDTNERGSAPLLKKLDYDAGWCVDFETWDHRITRAFPATEHPKKDFHRYGWLPSEGLARLYQANATRSRPIKLALADPTLSAKAEGTSGVYLSAGLTAMVDAGEVFTIKVTKDRLAFAIKSVGIYDKGTLLGKVNLETGSGEITIKAEQGKAYYALYAYEQVPSRFNPNARPDERISAPLLVMVRDPEMTKRIESQLTTTTLANKAKNNAIEPPKAVAKGAISGSDVIIASRLKESGAVRADGRISPQWATLKSVVFDEQKTAENTIGDPIKAQVGIKAAWDDTGLYLYYELRNNKEKPLKELLDFHLASIDPDQLYVDGSPNLSHFTKPGDTQLLRSALQFQFDVNGEQAGRQISLNYWDPWDCRQEIWSAATDFSATGAWYEVVTTGENEHAVEFYLPWAYVGNPGFTKTPPTGTTLAYLLGYALQAELTEEAEVPATQKMLWPRGQDPWRVPADEETPNSFGKIVLMP